MFKNDIISTGLNRLDRMLGGGFCGGSLSLIAAYPGMGKTTLALQIANQMADDGKRVLFFSLELLEQHIKTQILSKTGRTKINGRLIIEDKSPITVEEIAYILKVNGADIIFIDNLHLLDTRKTDPSSLVLAAGDSAYKLKQIALTEKIPIVVTSQLVKSVMNESDHRPQLRDLRKVCPEQDLDVILFPYRPSYYDGLTSCNDEQVELIVAKNRYGDRGMIPIRLDLENFTFKEIE